ncbi:MAG: TRAP transporter substrate-binding protein DctP [Steroidobacteraceae bacterium]|nr:TRAP transporter substrate-binding protein DctP [Steroidobacteraceae bacterium]
MTSPLAMRIILALVLVACGVGVWQSRAQQPEFTIRIAFLASKDDEDYIGAVAFKETVERLLPGRVEVRVFPSGQFCGNERECIEALQSGILEMHQTTIGGLAALYGAAQVLDLPYAFRDEAVAECVLDGPLVREIGQEILRQRLGLRLIAVGNTGGWRAFATTTRPLNGPDDLAGLRFRTLPSQLEQQMVRELDANPMPLAFSELYGALGAGLLDGTKNSPQDIVGQKLHDHLRYLYVDRHSYMTSIWWFSDARWRELPPDVQAAAREGFAALARATREAAARREAPALEDFARRGGTIVVATPEQREQLRAKTAGLRQWYVDNYGPRWLERMDAAVAACNRAAPAGPTQTE